MNVTNFDGDNKKCLHCTHGLIETLGSLVIFDENQTVSDIYKIFKILPKMVKFASPIHYSSKSGGLTLKDLDICVYTQLSSHALFSVFRKTENCLVSGVGLNRFVEHCPVPG